MGEDPEAFGKGSPGGRDNCPANRQSQEPAAEQEPLQHS
jgi:hypothetical protein